MYNGLGVTLIGSIPKAGIRFGANSWFKKLLANDKGKLNMGNKIKLVCRFDHRRCNKPQLIGIGQQFLAGMGAGTVEAVLAVTPMETVKTKLIERNLGLVEGLRTILRQVTLLIYLFYG